jgi:FkbM family methyltransferase
MPLSISKQVKKVFNEKMQELGYALKWTPPGMIAKPGRLIDVDFPMLAAHLMLTTPHPYFIGIGANDGVTHDPIYPFIRDFGWRGLMVEPIPEAFAALERNYADIKGVGLVQAAIGQTDGKGTIYTVEVKDDASRMMSLHSSFNRDVLLRGSRWHADLQHAVIEREVPIMSFPTLLAKTEGQAVDVLKVDAEGYDLVIMKTIDLARLAPKLILAEHANLSKPDKIRMADILLDNGYRVAMTPLDMLGYK